MSGQLHSPAVLPQGKNLCAHLIEVWMCTRVGLDVLKREVSLVPPGIRTAGIPARSLVTILTTMSWQLTDVSDVNSNSVD